MLERCSTNITKQLSPTLAVTLNCLICLQVKVVGPDSKPVSNEAVYLFAFDSQNLTLTTDTKGMASFSLDTTLWTDTVTLKVGHSFPEPFFPPRRISLADGFLLVTGSVIVSYTVNI